MPKISNLTRPGQRAGRSEMLTKRGRKAGHLAAFWLRVAYLKESLALCVRFPAKCGSQVCEHGAKSRQFPGQERRELSSMAAFSSRSSASSSDFAQPKLRSPLVGCTSYVPAAQLPLSDARRTYIRVFAPDLHQTRPSCSPTRQSTPPAAMQASSPA